MSHATRAWLEEARALRVVDIDPDSDPDLDAVVNALRDVDLRARTDMPSSFRKADRIKRKRGWLPWWLRNVGAGPWSPERRVQTAHTREERR